MQNKNLGLILYTKCIKDNDLFIKMLSNDDKIVSFTDKILIYKLLSFMSFTYNINPELLLCIYMYNF